MNAYGKNEMMKDSRERKKKKNCYKGTTHNNLYYFVIFFKKSVLTIVTCVKWRGKYLIIYSVNITRLIYFYIFYFFSIQTVTKFIQNALKED